jgi:hypothetical protein
MTMCIQLLSHIRIETKKNKRIVHYALQLNKKKIEIFVNASFNIPK